MLFHLLGRGVHRKCLMYDIAKCTCILMLSRNDFLLCLYTLLMVGRLLSNEKGLKSKAGQVLAKSLC